MINSGVASHWRVSIGGPESVPELGQRWRALEGRSQCSFFQSWDWLGPWFDTIGSRADVMVLEAMYRDSPVTLGLIGSNALRTGKLRSSPSILVSETGVDVHDDLAVEHNGLLIEHGCQEEALERCLGFLFGPVSDWKELVIGGLEARLAEVYARVARERGLHPRILSSHPYFRVDLTDLRRRETEYLSSLSANTRRHIRRALREYGRRGPVTLEAAKTREEAQAFFERLKELHQRRWTARNQRGAFFSDAVVRFHRRLIHTGVPKGRVQLLRAASGSTPFAYLYNFVYRGIVYNYQGGFVYEEDNKLKPGLVAHALAIQRNLELGHKQYDLLMGAQRYKRSLADEQGSMVRLAIRRRRSGVAIEQGWRMLERAARKMNPMGLRKSEMSE